MVICGDWSDTNCILLFISECGAAPLGKDTAPLLRSNPANDRISVVQETYESTLIMAEGYNRKLLKSEADMLEELQQAIGEALPYRHESCPSHREENGALPAT